MAAEICLSIEGKKGICESSLDKVVYRMLHRIPIFIEVTHAVIIFSLKTDNAVLQIPPLLFGPWPRFSSLSSCGCAFNQTLLILEMTQEYPLGWVPPLNYIIIVHII